MRQSKALTDAMKAAERAVLDRQHSNHVYGLPAGAPPMAAWPTGPCRIIFLDLDGVLNSEQSFQKFGTRQRFGPASVAALNQILRQTGALMVITSSWREALTLREIVGYLERSGVLPGKVIGQTRWLETARGLEIDDWLRFVPYEVSSFVILDDRSDMEMHSGRLVLINPQAGLTTAYVARAVDLLLADQRDL